MSINEITEANLFKLGTPIVLVSFTSATRALKLTKEHLAQLQSGFSDFKALEDLSSPELNSAQQALLIATKARVAYSEVRGFRRAIRRYCDEFRPIFRLIFTGYKQISATYTFCLLEIFLGTPGPRPEGGGDQ